MTDYKLCDSELKFADIVWENEPINSGELVKLCESNFSWKKSTTYTVLKKLCEKGILMNENSIVSSIISKEQFFQLKSEKLIEDNFGGSLPKFISAFISSKKLSKKQILEIQAIIDNYKEEV